MTLVQGSRENFEDTFDWWEASVDDFEDHIGYWPEESHV